MPVLLRAMRSNERVSYFNEHAWLGYADIYARPTKNCIYNSTTRLHQLGEESHNKNSVMETLPDVAYFHAVAYIYRNMKFEIGTIGTFRYQHTNT